MGSTYEPLKIALSEKTLQLCADASANFSEAADALCQVTPSDLVGDADASVLATAITALVCEKGHQGMTVRSWHVLRAERLSAASAHVRDISSTDTASIICVLLCVAGQGTLSLAKPSDTEKPTIKMNKIQLQHQQCIVYQCNVTYAVHQSSATYLHCVCARGAISCDVAVHQLIRFPCPYNTTSELGDVRAYHRSYDPLGTGECTYRGSKWKNVLDHLMNCKANPDVDKCAASQAKRRARNKKQVWCDLCTHPGFYTQNTLVQHKRRHHPNAKEIIPVHTRSAIAEDTEVDHLAWLDDLAIELPREDTCQVSPLPKRRKLQRRREITRSVPLEDVSLLEAFEICLSSPRENETTAIPPVDMVTVNHAQLEMHPPSTQEDEKLTISLLEPLSITQTYEMVTSMLSSVTKADIRQPAGMMEKNASEMSLDGVTAMLTAFGDILPGDVFADVGSGVGNVSIQVALQSRLDKSIAIEMREELATLTTAIVAKHKANEPRLGKLVVIEADITQIDFADLPHMIGVTHLFSHNTLFDPKAMLKLETVCLLPKLRRMALSLLPCSRHSDR